jgi:hypothetical protein
LSPVTQRPPAPHMPPPTILESFPTRSRLLQWALVPLLKSMMHLGITPSRAALLHPCEMINDGL